MLAALGTRVICDNKISLRGSSNRMLPCVRFGYLKRVSQQLKKNRRTDAAKILGLDSSGDLAYAILESRFECEQLSSGIKSSLMLTGMCLQLQR